VPFYQDAPYCVVLENSDHASEAHARAQFEQLLEAAMERLCVVDAVVAESLAQAKALWHIRESIPLAQAREGLNIKHDISIAVSRIPEFVRPTDALLEHAFPGMRLVNYGHLGDGNLHYNVQGPARRGCRSFFNRAGKAAESTPWFTTACSSLAAPSRPSTALAASSATNWRSTNPPLHWQMMRAIKHRAGPAQCDEPGAGFVNALGQTSAHPSTF
jgi:hypothetical protein